HPPAKIAAILNALTLTEMETENYFTMAYADIDLVSGDVHIVQAGHPHPLLHRADGAIERLGQGGPPIGLIPDMTYDSFSTKLEAGDRLLIASDGVTECPDPAGTLLEDEGAEQILRHNHAVRGTAFLDAMMWSLAEHAQDEEFPDDISAILFQFGGAKVNAD
ncbi:MAG: PP2C family protein-serine/threonine phosphatase, partial [Pseudomonadota bacterium]